MIDLNLFENITDEEFQDMLEALSEKEQLVLLLLRGVNGSIPMSREEVARELGLTDDEIRSIEARALETIERMNSGWRENSFVIVHGDGTLEEF